MLTGIGNRCCLQIPGNVAGCWLGSSWGRQTAPSQLNIPKHFLKWVYVNNSIFSLAYGHAPFLGISPVFATFEFRLFFFCFYLTNMISPVWYFLLTSLKYRFALRQGSLTIKQVVLFFSFVSFLRVKWYSKA